MVTMDLSRADVPLDELLDRAPAERRHVAPRRRVQGLRFPVLPSSALLAQMAGGVAFAVGLYQAAGGAVTLIVAGAVTAVLGALKEAGKV